MFAFILRKPRAGNHVAPVHAEGVPYVSTAVIQITPRRNQEPRWQGTPQGGARPGTELVRNESGDARPQDLWRSVEDHLDGPGIQPVIVIEDQDKWAGNNPKQMVERCVFSCIDSRMEFDLERSCQRPVRDGRCRAVRGSVIKNVPDESDATLRLQRLEAPAKELHPIVCCCDNRDDWLLKIVRDALAIVRGARLSVRGGQRDPSRLTTTGRVRARTRRSCRSEQLRAYT